METSRLEYKPVPHVVRAAGIGLQVSSLVPSHKRLLRLGMGNYRVGSDPLAEVPLLFPSIAKHHGCLSVSDGSVIYEALNFKNPSYVSLGPHQPLVLLQRGQAAKLGMGARVYVGPFVLVVIATHASEEIFQKFLKLAHDQLIFRLTQASSALKITQVPEALILRTVKELRATQFPEEAVEPVFRYLKAEFNGHGPFSDLISSPQCREIVGNGYDRLFIDLGQGLRAHAPHFLSRFSYDLWVRRLVQETGRRLDLAHPICEGVLHSGARLEVLIPPLTQDEPALTIRKHTVKNNKGPKLPSFSEPERMAKTQSQLLAKTSLTPQQELFFKNCVKERKNILISGGTGSGKTTLLRHLCEMTSSLERLIVIEDTFELGVSAETHPNLVMLQAREANEEGKGSVSLRDLVRSSLRMHPDRIIVGECRGAEVIDMLQAMNSGHQGSMTTTHANGVEEALSRLELLVLLELKNVSSSYVKQWVRSSFQVVVQMEKVVDESGDVHLRVKQVLEIQ